jgi:hypothetical protein
MPAKASKIPASVKFGSPKESWSPEPSDLVQLRKSVVIVAGAAACSFPDGSGFLKGRMSLLVERITVDNAVLRTPHATHPFNLPGRTSTGKMGTQIGRLR